MNETTTTMNKYYTKWFFVKYFMQIIMVYVHNEKVMQESVFK